MSVISPRRVRAAWDDRGVVVYQAFEPRIAEEAVRTGTFGRGFGMDRLSLALKTAPVRVQWDPDRDLHTRPLERRAIQIGLGPSALEPYVRRWVVAIEDVTALAHSVRDAARSDAPLPAVPVERDYSLPDAIARALAVTPLEA